MGDNNVTGDRAVMLPPTPYKYEELEKKVNSLVESNNSLKTELTIMTLRTKQLEKENMKLRQASVIIQAQAEQEEEYISNTLFKKIHVLKKEKETLALNYEQEEECLTNELTRKLCQLRDEKAELERSLEQEQEALVSKLMKRIEQLEALVVAKQQNLEQLRREKVELENTVEQEQEALVNRLWKKMEKLEAEKRILQSRSDGPSSAAQQDFYLDRASFASANDANGQDISIYAAGLESLEGSNPMGRVSDILPGSADPRSVRLISVSSVDSVGGYNDSGIDTLLENNPRSCTGSTSTYSSVRCENCGHLVNKRNAVPGPSNVLNDERLDLKLIVPDSQVPSQPSAPLLED